MLAADAVVAVSEGMRRDVLACYPDVAPAKVTVRHNGVVIHDNVELKKPTPGGGLSGKDTAEPGPIQLQGHGNPVFYRNIWIVEKK